MIVQERKSKYKTKVTVSGSQTAGDMHEWCLKSYGPGGRKSRWRRGWVGQDTTFYFRSKKDAMMFSLRWSAA